MAEDDMLARVLLRQATLTTARCASVIHCEYLAGASIGELAERYGLDESTIEWWCDIDRLRRPLDAPATYRSPDPTPLRTYAPGGGD